MTGNSSSGIKFGKPREALNFLLCIPKQNAALAREFDGVEQCRLRSAQRCYRRQQQYAGNINRLQN